MASPWRSVGEGASAEEGGDAVARLQEPLRLQEQKAERRLQEALQLQEQRAAMALREVVRQMVQRLQEKEEVFCSWQRRLSTCLQNVEERVAATEEGATTSERPAGEGALQWLEARIQKEEDSLENSMEQFFPALEELEHSMEEFFPAQEEPENSMEQFFPALEEQEHSMEEFFPAQEEPENSMGQFFPALVEPEVVTPEALLRQPESLPTEVPPSASASTSSACEATATGGAAAGALEEERERQRMQFRALEAKERRDRARASPSALGEQLCRAANEGGLSDVRRLLDCGADVNYTGRNGLTPLTSAAWDDADVMSLLLERGAHVNAVSASGNSALHFASEDDRSGQCVHLLIIAGADVNARDLKGVTPLHRAADGGNQAAAWTLLTAGARRDLKGWGGDWKGKTPFDVATSATVRVLLRP